jgi:hypothetical protein
MKVMHPRIKQALGLLGGALAAFHGWLFVAQAASGQLVDPGLIFRWVAAASLLVALAAVRRRGHSLWSRQGIAIWVLAALLHGPAVATDPGLDSIALPETVAASVLQLLSTAALAIGLLSLARLLRGRKRVAAFAVLAANVTASVPIAPGAVPQLFSRPPPTRA